jgi:hypothetical protein
MKNNLWSLNNLYALLIFFVMLFFGWKREDQLIVLNKSGFQFLNKYPKTEITNYNNEIGNLLNFNISPKLQSSVFFSLIYRFKLSYYSILL